LKSNDFGEGLMKGSSGADSTAFLLTQVGSHAAAMFAKRLAPLRLDPPHVGLLRAVAASEGQSQQVLSETLSAMPSKLVQLLDDLEDRHLIERREHPTDRRTHALHLTSKGRQMLESIGRIVREHEDALCAALTDSERAQLTALLGRIARSQSLAPGVHPGFQRLGRGRKSPE
jgi:DNA-binding MarR family transcriptional regulator